MRHLELERVHLAGLKQVAGPRQLTSPTFPGRAKQVDGYFRIRARIVDVGGVGGHGVHRHVGPGIREGDMEPLLNAVLPVQPLAAVEVALGLGVSPATRGVR